MGKNMKKYSTISIISAGFIFLGLIANAQMMQGGGMMGSGAGASEDADDHTAREEAEGKEIWEKFQKKEKTCDKLSDDDFGALGEYFMGLMMGANHAAMNQMMINTMGEKGEEAMHIVMGKRLSGCDTSAAFPAGGYGFMPMMGMWGGANDAKGISRWGWGFGPMMMTGYGGFGWLGWIFPILWWALVIFGVVAAVRWLAKRGKSGSALDLLKERYAKGEITKQQFEEMKKDIG